VPRQAPRKRLASALGYVVVLLLALEIGVRLAWKLDRNVPFFQPHRLIEGFYKQLNVIKSQSIQPDDAYFDVLLLGGSVTSKFYAVERLLYEKLNYRTSRPARIHNASHPAHTSLDSLYKYRALQDQSFDLVIIDHGINETRTNNCPPDVFQADYSHYAWYRQIRAIRQHKELPYTVVPYTLHFLWINLQDALGSSALIPFRQTRPEWFHYGETIKTAAPFRQNLTDILRLAERKREPVFLMTFAYYIAEGYTQEQFLNKTLDYTLHKPETPIEMWGTPDNVAKGLEVHNAIIRELARQYGHAELIDQQALMPASGRYYLDICHLTIDGATRWVEPVLRALGHATPEAAARSESQDP
jgi:hypothetical protein